MKKIFLSIILLGALSINLFAIQAVLVCRTNGMSYDTYNVVGIDCGNISSFQCEQRLKNALKNKYGQYDAYDAEVKACKKVRGDLYPHKIKIIY